jgi:hypothetical protein
MFMLQLAEGGLAARYMLTRIRHQQWTLGEGGYVCANKHTVSPPVLNP